MGPGRRRYFADWQEGYADLIDPPEDGTAWMYQCYVDTVIGEWMFAVENWGSIPGYIDAAFLYSGTSAQWTSELRIYEDDMTGTAADPCSITEMSVDVNGVGDGSGFQTIASGPDDHCECDEPDLWGIDRTSAPDQMEIWDKYPNPSLP